MMYWNNPLHRKTKHTKRLAVCWKRCHNQRVIIYLANRIISLWFLFCKRFLRKEGDIMYIFRASFTTKDGTKIYAKTYGKRAFRIWIGPGPEPVKK